MRNRRIRVLHEGNEYYLVDSGRGAASRVITFLRRAEKKDEDAGGAGAVVVKTDLGDCVAVASWREGRLSVARGSEELRAALTGIIERYLEEFRVGRRRTTSRVYFFLSIERQPLFSLSSAHPSGLSVLVYRDEELASKAAAERRGLEGREVRVERTGDLFDFLAARATEGFAGAMLDELDPIYFCLDVAGAPRFLRLSLDQATGRLEHFLLDSDGGWTPYEGEEELTPEIDQEAVDTHMVERLGDVPFLGYHEGMALLRPVRRAEPGALVSVHLTEEADGDEAQVCPLFHDEELARAFLHEHMLDECELARVEDLRQFATRAGQEGKVARIHPGGHRARSATLWVCDSRLVLDSFSGLWFSGDGRDFAKLEQG